MENNLINLKDFIEETFGAICFYNDSNDGWKKFGYDKKINTLSIYFPNEIDLQNVEAKTRLSQVAGDEFYKRYKNTNNNRITPAMGSVIIAQFAIDDKTIMIKRTNVGLSASPFINFVIDYFIGKSFGEFFNFDVCKDINTNNDFCIKKGSNAKIALENYLNDSGKQIISKENGFFVFQTKNIVLPNNKIIKVEDTQPENLMQKYFGNYWNEIEQIQINRNKYFEKSLQSLSKQDWNDYKKMIGMDCSLENNPEFDD